jgi:hypothetical protein
MGAPVGSDEEAIWKGNCCVAILEGLATAACCNTRAPDADLSISGDSGQVGLAI